MLNLANTEPPKAPTGPKILADLDDAELAALLRGRRGRIGAAQVKLMRHLIEKCNVAGELTLPKLPDLAAATGLRRQSVQRMLRILGARGAIEIEKRTRLVAHERKERVLRIRLDQPLQPLLPFGRVG
jgi:hypothetical protein